MLKAMAPALGLIFFLSGLVFAEEVKEYPVPRGSHPHDVAPAPDGRIWYTAQGTGELGRLRVDPPTREVRRFPLPQGRPNANLNTATFDREGVLWFTGQAGVYGRLEPKTGRMDVFDAPKGPGPYGIATTPKGAVYYASLAGITSPGSIRRAARRPSSSLPPRGRGPAGFGPIHTAGSGSASGMRVRSRCTTRPRRPGRAGDLRGRSR
jgi:virginiamycin B lyase